MPQPLEAYRLDAGLSAGALEDRSEDSATNRSAVLAVEDEPLEVRIRCAAKWRELQEVSGHWTHGRER